MTFLLLAIWIVLLEIATTRSIRNIFPQYCLRHKQTIRKIFIAQAAAALIIVFCGSILAREIRDYRIVTLYYYLFGILLTIYASKSVFVVSMGIDMLVRHARHKTNNPTPRHLIAKSGILFSIITALLIVWGMIFGRHNYDIQQVEISFDNLPPAFDGYKIVQISDLHAGSSLHFTNRLQQAVDIINRQHPDLIVFTGDMVNNFAEEAQPLIPIFSQLKATDGQFATLGNHDYGGYHNWKNPTDSVANHTELEKAIRMMNFTLLKNEATVISRDSLSQIAVVGIENWGIKKWNPKRGNLSLATQQVDSIAFKILLSHDPAFWHEKMEHKTNIALTLSGHTHGMQLSLKLGNTRISGARLRSRHWWGLYHTGTQYLYVNCGLGVIGYPGRVGMPPEITVITLRN